MRPHFYSNLVFAIRAELETRTDWVVEIQDWVNPSTKKPDKLLTFSTRSPANIQSEGPPDRWPDMDTGSALLALATAGDPIAPFPMKRISVKDVAEEFLAIDDEKRAKKFLAAYGPLHLWGPYQGTPEPMFLSDVFEHVDRHTNMLASGTVAYPPEKTRYHQSIMPPDDPALKLLGDPDFKLLANFHIQSIDSYSLHLGLNLGEDLTATILCKTPEEAVRTFVFLERLNGSGWARCIGQAIGGHACGKLFKKPTARRQTCPDDLCASRASSHNSYHDPKNAQKRARAKKASKGIRRQGRVQSLEYPD